MARLPRENLCIGVAPGGTTSKGWEVWPPGSPSSTVAALWRGLRSGGASPVSYTFPAIGYFLFALGGGTVPRDRPPWVF